MKIGIFSPYLNTFGGGERYILTIAENFSKKHDVSLFWDEDLTKKALYRFSIDLKRTKFVNNIFNSKQSLLKRLAITRQYDLLIFLSDGSLPFSLAKHNIIHFQRPFINGKNIVNLLKLKNVDFVVCNSQFIKKLIDKAYGVNSKVIYPPVETAEFFEGKKQKLIISVGRFHHFKKQHELVSAFLKLNIDCPDWRLVLIGGLLDQDKKYFEELEKLAKNNKNIKLLPNENFANLKKYYSQSEIYWHAAGFGEDEQLHPERMEHFGITTVEAMASGCIPIVYDGGGQREIIKHGENGYLWKTEEDLLSITRKIVKNPHFPLGSQGKQKFPPKTADRPLDEKIKIRNKAIQDSKNYDKDVFINEFDKLIKSLS